MYKRERERKIDYRLFNTLNGEAAFDEIFICCCVFPFKDTGGSDNLKILVELHSSFDDGIIPLIESE
jgi:hypothetical protein